MKFLSNEIDSHNNLVFPELRQSSMTFEEIDRCSEEAHFEAENYKFLESNGFLLLLKDQHCHLNLHYLPS